MPKEGTQVAKAIVTVIPSMEGARTAIGKEIPAMVGAASDEAGVEGGKKIGGGISSGLSTMKLAIGNMLGNILTSAASSAVGAIKDTFTSAFENYADFQQLEGGVETLFANASGDASDIVKENAKKAFETAGMSANEYMETVTGFSASLVSSLGGDVYAAAGLADKALVDMSDNANKMGTDMDRITDAYGGFAKQNYTMLDNLKLGYGGTKGEMERLLKDAEAMKASQGEYVDYSIDSFGDIVEAIHVVQENMGITGTTAEEAGATISGSIGMAQSAWEDWLTGLANPDADMSQLTQNLVKAIKTVIQNAAPAIKEMLSGAFEGITSLLDEIGLGGVADFMRGLKSTFESPEFQGALNNIFQLISTIGTGLGEIFASFAPDGEQASEVFKSIAEAVGSVVGIIADNWPTIQSVLETIGGIVGTVFGALWEILCAIGDTIGYIAGLVAEELGPEFSEMAGVDFSNLGDTLKVVVDFVKDIVLNGLAWIKENGPVIADVIATVAQVFQNTFGIVADILGGVVNALVAVGELLMGNPEKAEEAAQKMIECFGRIPERIIKFFEKIPEMIAKIFSDIKLPELHIDGEFDLFAAGGPKLPTISFYAKGGIATNPGIIGEAGPELAWPSYSPYFDKYAAGIAEHMDGSVGGDTYFVIDGAKINASEEMTRNFYNNMMDLKRLGVMQSGYAQ